MADSDIRDWFAAIPPYTQLWFTSTFVVTLAANFGLLDPRSLILFGPALARFEIWRLVSCFLFMGKLGFPFLINMMFLYRQAAPAPPPPSCCSPRARVAQPNSGRRRRAGTRRRWSRSSSRAADLTSSS